MPGRDIPLITSHVYHVFNRGIGRQPIFFTKRDYQRFIDILWYYLPVNPPIRYSKFLSLTVNQRNQLLVGYFKLPRIVSCIAYCLMPNHFHLLLEQESDGGISKYVSNVCNSYTRYINTKKNQLGPLLQGKFKAVRIENDEQLLHVSRYIHLNPFTSALIDPLDKLQTYPYSSLPHYAGYVKNEWLKADRIYSHFRTRKDYLSFVYNQADYQKKLKEIKHLMLDDEK